MQAATVTEAINPDVRHLLQDWLVLLVKSAGGLLVLRPHLMMVGPEAMRS